MMKPIEFDEQSLVLTRPESWEEEDCSPLPVYYSDFEYISCWKMSWKDRIMALLFGKIWLFVYGAGHPPVAVVCDKTVFLKNDTTSGKNSL